MNSLLEDCYFLSHCFEKKTTDYFPFQPVRCTVNISHTAVTQFVDTQLVHILKLTKNCTFSLFHYFCICSNILGQCNFDQGNLSSGSVEFTRNIVYTKISTVLFKGNTVIQITNITGRTKCENNFASFFSFQIGVILKSSILLGSFVACRVTGFAYVLSPRLTFL